MLTLCTRERPQREKGECGLQEKHVDYARDKNNTMLEVKLTVG